LTSLFNFWLSIWYPLFCMWRHCKLQHTLVRHKLYSHVCSKVHMHERFEVIVTSLCKILSSTFLLTELLTEIITVHFNLQKYLVLRFLWRENNNSAPAISRNVTLCSRSYCHTYQIPVQNDQTCQKASRVKGLGCGLACGKVDAE
jgi:hypothetical protein